MREGFGTKRFDNLGSDLKGSRKQPRRDPRSKARQRGGFPELNCSGLIEAILFIRVHPCSSVDFRS